MQIGSTAPSVVPASPTAAAATLTLISPTPDMSRNTGPTEDFPHPAGVTPPGAAPPLWSAIQGVTDRSTPSSAAPLAASSISSAQVLGPLTGGPGGRGRGLSVNVPADDVTCMPGWY